MFFVAVPLQKVSVLFFQESYTYKDPITEFVECLYVNFDFDNAQKKLRECEAVSPSCCYILPFYYSVSLKNMAQPLQ